MARERPAAGTPGSFRKGEYKMEALVGADKSQDPP